MKAKGYYLIMNELHELSGHNYNVMFWNLMHDLGAEIDGVEKENYYKKHVNESPEIFIANKGRSGYSLIEWDKFVDMAFAK